MSSQICFANWYEVCPKVMCWQKNCWMKGMVLICQSREWEISQLIFSHKYLTGLCFWLSTLELEKPVKMWMQLYSYENHIKHDRAAHARTAIIERWCFKSGVPMCKSYGGGKRHLGRVKSLNKSVLLSVDPLYSLNKIHFVWFLRVSYIFRVGLKAWSAKGKACWPERLLPRV